MRVIVACGRNYHDKPTIRAELMTLPFDAVIVHGGARGDRAIARIWTDEFGGTVEEIPADWDRYGKAAGPIRNQAMIDAGGDLMMSFPGGRGTADCTGRARQAGIRVHRIPVRH